MAASIDFDVVAEVEKEITCPVCWKEFKEPKCLPSCAHNVCRHCLEGIARKKKDAIECPVCRVESIIPNNGVAAFPKNHLLVRLRERILGRKEDKVIREAIKRCKEKVDGAKIAIQEMEDRLETAKTLDEEMKQRIKSLVENIVTKAREQEQKMFHQLQLRENGREKSLETLKSSCLELCENASSCIQTAECALQIGELDALRSIKVESLNDFSRSLDARISEAKTEFTQATNVSLTDTDLVEKLKTPGKRTITASTHQDVGPGSGMLFCEPVVDFSRCGSLIKTIDNSSSSLAIFYPSSVAASRISNHLVALDEESNLVYIFDENWKLLHTFHIKFGDLWGVAISNDNDIVVVNRDNNRLLHYNMNGHFKRKFVVYNRRNVKFSSLSVDINGRFIISSCSYANDDDDESETERDFIFPCVLVYNPASGEFIMLFGKESLIIPEQAVFMNGKFFVADSGCGAVMVFDNNGDFCNAFGSEQLESPCGIAADYTNGNLVVCDKENNTIHIYSQTGHQLHRFRIAHIPNEVAFTKNYKNLLISCAVDSVKSCIQMVTYS